MGELFNGVVSVLQDEDFYSRLAAQYKRIILNTITLFT